MKWFFWLSVALAAASLPASAADRLATAATLGKDPTLTVSTADCADNPECIVASFTCENSVFSVSVNGLETNQAGALLKDGRREGKLSADKQTFALQAEKLQFTEMDGAWQVDLAHRDTPAAVWKALASAKRIALSLGGHSFGFAGDKNVAKVAKACAK